MTDSGYLLQYTSGAQKIQALVSSYVTCSTALRGSQLPRFDFILVLHWFHCLIVLAKKGARSTKRTPWTSEEKSALHVSLGKYFYTKGLPGKHEIMQCLGNHSCLRNRTWTNVKDFLRNHQLKL